MDLTAFRHGTSRIWKSVNSTLSDGIARQMSVRDESLEDMDTARPRAHEEFGAVGCPFKTKVGSALPAQTTTELQQKITFSCHGSSSDAHDRLL
jgi:hypothetical protein